jgi:hypothetical protein
MGSQQLLLILVGVLMIGLMIAFGIMMFVDSASASNRDAVANDLAQFASKAQAYQKKPKCIGGGGGSFVGFSLGSPEKKNLNGAFTVVDPTQVHVMIQGLGKETGYDKQTPVKVAVRVSADSIAVEELN